ncbi:MAG: efflux transporter outer membrane subunit [Parachlamydiaceae bacterium]|nr:efflux transporter outer membrane subunit [Parachlamydiaceae bacterium]
MNTVLAFSKLTILTFLIVTVTSCQSTSRSTPIDLPVSAIEIAIQDTSEDPIFDPNDWLPINWWIIFNDPQLTSFIETAIIKNPTLQIAQANILKSKYAADSVRASLYPSLYWGGDISRQKLSETGLAFPNGTGNPSKPSSSSASSILPTSSGPAPANAPFAGGSAGIPVYFTQYETELAFTYDFDIWKKNRNTLKAAIGELNARIADEAFTRLQLSISVAKVYFQLQIYYKLLKNAQDLVKNQSQYNDLTLKRVENSLDNVIGANIAKTNLTTSKQSLLQIQADIAISEYHLKSLLAGNFDEEIQNIEITEQPLPKFPLPADLPLNLIAHRPDITAQLWIINSAGRQIDVAQAGFYPDFNLSALVGFQSLHLLELFQGRSTYFNVDPAFSLPIFDGGRLIANLRNREIDYDLAIYQYNNLVLNATREVLEGIAVLRNSDQQLNEFTENLNYQEENFRIANLLMTHNLNSGIDSLVSEETVIIARNQEIVALGNRYQAMLSLIKALGGGYDSCYEEGF